MRPVCTGCDTDWRQITPGRDLLDHVGFLGVDRALAVDRLAERIDHAAEQFGTDRHFQNAAGALDRVAFGNVLVLAQHHRADRVALEVQCETEGVLRKLQHLALHHVGQAVNAADTVGHGNDRALGAHVGGERQILDLALDQLADFGRIQLLHGGLLT